MSATRRRLLAIALVVASFVGWRLLHGSATDRRSYDHRTAALIGVVDGETLDVSVGGQPVRVRLIGVIAPMPPPLTHACIAYLSARATQATLTLRLDEFAPSRDRDGRLFAYVYLAGEELLNESMLRDGIAFDDRSIDCDLSAQLAIAENNARSLKRGLWKTITTEQMPESRRAWMRANHLE